ncbi:type 1 glutamine amidotransferase domain-containing protein [Thalassomonas sp. RHCl1]|uniref:type 1 glutamine amidotransferase domain-containing protein n=1 Tax=Thalassomonas sp. RHCl1 TaxID=2995320 RepID=UPI00248CFF8F|nr:type 1 glutamine amidotransferase domain-containing protein [Thalassomonas sp. RHCl1]
MTTKRILIPLPGYGCDPSEVAIPWRLLTEQQHQVTFITPNGQTARCDDIMLTGKKLGLLKPMLMARADAVQAYKAMQTQESFQQPLTYAGVKADDFDALLLPGGHDKGVKEYLESDVLQQLVVDFFRARKPVAAICHGVLLAARSIDPATGKSVIYDYNCTGLLKTQELTAYNLTRLWLGDYYLTYPGTTTEDELLTVLARPGQFLEGPFPLLRDDTEHLNRGFFVKDRNYLSARWPGDLYGFSLAFIEMLTE